MRGEGGRGGNEGGEVWDGGTGGMWGGVVRVEGEGCEVRVTGTCIAIIKSYFHTRKIPTSTHDTVQQRFTHSTHHAGWPLFLTPS